MRELAVKLISLAMLLALVACERSPEAVSSEPGRTAQDIHQPTGIETITAADLHAKIAVLASDEFEGRAPSSPGEEMTASYLRDEMKSYGLEPGNNGSWFQQVPLVAITADDQQSLVVSGGDGDDIILVLADDYVAGTVRVVDEINISDSELVFVGYGIVAPEYGWNDYAGIDMTGKTAVILVNDPGYATRDESLFTGFAMTYYGRWTYKYEEAMRQGAEAALIVHETGAAGYPWNVVRSGWTGKNFHLESADGNLTRVKAEGWLSSAAAEAIIAKAGHEFSALSEAAAKAGFKPVPLGLNAALSFTNIINHSLSKNVVGIVRGSENPDEAFLYIAHWDHFGIGEEVNGDNIYNGARDNASGTAALLELAEAFSSLEIRPKRSMVFVAVTAEEQGLLGSQYYGENPLFPLNKTIGGLNIDGLNLYGPTKDIVITGYGLSELDADLERAAAAQGRVTAPDPHVEKGYYYRSDHFNLAKVGVPMIYPKNGIDHVEFGPEHGQAQADEYVAERYHKPNDEYDPDWDLSGGEQDVKLYFMVGNEVANGDLWPNWNPGTEFRSTRDESMGGAR
jgi:Zn-dependent M28 family amino/carboxypeptidase